MWFEIEEAPDGADPDDYHTFSPAERRFVEVLRDRAAGWDGRGVSSDVSRPEADDGVLLAFLSLGDPDDDSAPVLLDFGVHVRSGRVRGDRLHNQLFLLPDQPSGWALEAAGTVRELAERSADWFESVLRRPVVLGVWLHDRYAYAARYFFADSDETLSQCWNGRLAPPGREDELIAAGHVRGRGWIQTSGLPPADVYLHVRGDLGEAVLPPGARMTDRRGPVGGVWYE